MDIELIIYILIGIGVFFALPSTMYTFMFFGIFYRHKVIRLEKDDLKDTHYYPYAEKLKKDILQVKELPCEMVKIKAKDGVSLCARYYDRNFDKAIIFAHGYQSNSFNNFATATLDFLNEGYNVLLIDQRAHGDSGGKFTTLGCKEKEDLQLWIDYVAQKKEITDIVVYGISMGATTVGYAAQNIKTDKVKALIMEAGFTCFYDELESSVGPIFMRQAALKYVYLMSKTVLGVDIKQSVETSLKNNTIPVLFLHGDDDKDVSIEFTKRSYLACAGKKEMLTVEGAGHTLCYIAGGRPIQQKIRDFIDACIEKREN